MDPTRTAIIEATADAYADNRTKLTPEAICEAAGIERSAFDLHFDDVSDVIRAWYPYAVDGVAEQIVVVSDFDALPLQDRLGTFCFMLLDVLESRLPFVKVTFKREAAGFGSPFHLRLREALQTVLHAPNVPGVNYVLVDTDATRFVITESMVQMIGAWLNDESHDRARATALIDRVLALLAEMMTNRVPERAVDLVRYAVEAGYLPLDRLPLIGDMFGPTERGA